MSNIKTVEVIKATAGLEVGDVLTRNNKEDNFELNIETITDNYSAKRIVSISESLLNKNEFKAIEWFVEKPKTNRQRIEELEKELEYVGETLLATTAKLIEAEDQLAKYNKRINSKLNEFRAEFDRVSRAIDNGEYTGQLLWDADESLTVHYNMIDLLEKIIA